MINPLAMQLLLPILKSGSKLNFFEMMEPYAPELRNIVDAFPATHGEVCNNLRVFIRPGTKQTEYMAHVLACTLVRLAEDRFMVTLSDVSKQVAQERRLGEAEVWFASLLDGVNDFAVLSLDANGTINSANSSLIGQTGFTEEDVLGRTLEILDAASPASSVVTVEEQISLARRDGWYLVEGWHVRKHSAPYWCQRLIAVRTEEGDDASRVVSGYTVVLREVAKQRHDAMELKRMLTRDHLTGAANRAHFFEVAELECTRHARYGQPLAIVALDVDHFKTVNDTYGHPAGDQVLREVAGCCMALLRPEDTFARVGGEEFIVLLPNTDLEGAKRLAERLRLAVAAKAIASGHESLSVTGSFGCVEATAELCVLLPLIEAADKALYEAKQMGRNRVVVANEAELVG